MYYLWKYLIYLNKNAVQISLSFVKSHQHCCGFKLLLQALNMDKMRCMEILQRSVDALPRTGTNPGNEVRYLK